jgi:hypothetical protein|tara:strand:+ start:304 stop:678 length:375 start_codon:yes stop_codon:yes gene_type:complete
MVLSVAARKTAQALLKRKTDALRATKRKKTLLAKRFPSRKKTTEYDDFKVYPDKRKSGIFKQKATGSYQQKYGRDPPKWEKAGKKAGWYNPAQLREINMLNKIKADHPNWSDLKIKQYLDAGGR